MFNPQEYANAEGFENGLEFQVEDTERSRLCLSQNRDEIVVRLLRWDGPHDRTTFLNECYESINEMIDILLEAQKSTTPETPFVIARPCDTDGFDKDGHLHINIEADGVYFTTSWLGQRSSVEIGPFGTEAVDRIRQVLVAMRDQYDEVEETTVYVRRTRCGWEEVIEDLDDDLAEYIRLQIATEVYDPDQQIMIRLLKAEAAELKRIETTTVTATYDALRRAERWLEAERNVEAHAALHDELEELGAVYGHSPIAPITLQVGHEYTAAIEDALWRSEREARVEVFA